LRPYLSPSIGLRRCLHPSRDARPAVLTRISYLNVSHLDGDPRYSLGRVPRATLDTKPRNLPVARHPVEALFSHERLAVEEFAHSGLFIMTRRVVYGVGLVLTIACTEDTSSRTRRLLLTCDRHNHDHCKHRHAAMGQLQPRTQHSLESTSKPLLIYTGRQARILVRAPQPLLGRHGRVRALPAHIGLHKGPVLLQHVAHRRLPHLLRRGHRAVHASILRRYRGRRRAATGGGMAGCDWRAADQCGCAVRGHGHSGMSPNLPPSASSYPLQAYLFDYDSRFWDGWHLDTCFHLVTLSWALLVLAAIGIWLSALYLPTEGDYELIPDDHYEVPDDQ
jgi:hypothetical protein